MLCPQSINLVGVKSLVSFIRSNVWLPLVIIAVAVVLYQFVDPAPPRTIVMATGSAEGRYFEVGHYLNTELARQGIELQILETAGSGENLARLTDPGSDVSIALVQSGMDRAVDTGAAELHSLGSLYYEPLWLFYRSDLAIDSISGLKGKRVAIGEPGSGTRAVAVYLMGENGLNASEQATLLHLGGEEAVAALGSGAADAAFFTVSPSSETIRSLIALDDVGFLDIRRSPAYAAHHPFLSPVTISEGLLDLERNLPPEDHRTLASAATLVVNDDFHPAFTPLLLEALSRSFRRGGMLEKPGEFPSRLHTDFELTPEARHFFESGPPFLLRYLPFWAASLVDRLVIFIVPLVVIILPLVKLAGPVYRWRMRARIYRWYRFLLETDRKIVQGGVSDLKEERGKLHALSDELSTVEVPLSFSDELYQLKQHAEYVMRRLESNR